MIYLQENGCTVAQQGLLYVAGYVAWRFREKYPELGTITKNLNLPHKSEEWILTASNGHLRYPSADMIELAMAMEEVFIKVHGYSGFCPDTNIIKFVVNKTIEAIPETTISLTVLTCLVRTRTYIRINSLNNELKSSHIQNQQRKKMKKIINK